MAKKSSKNQVMVNISDIKKFRKMSDKEIKQYFNKTVVAGLLDAIKRQEGKPDTCIILWKYRF
jgi:Na+-transporting NADH:ubiquinone oxidoreductase subunit NqrC